MNTTTKKRKVAVCFATAQLGRTQTGRTASTTRHKVYDEETKNKTGLQKGKTPRGKTTAQVTTCKAAATMIRTHARPRLRGWRRRRQVSFKATRQQIQALLSTEERKRARARQLALLRRGREKARALLTDVGSVSRDEFDERVWAAHDELHRGVEERSRTRTWEVRLWQLNEWARGLWTKNRERIAASVPRYVEGLPARETLRPPVFRLPRGAPPAPLQVHPCLQCQLKKLPCSRTRPPLRGSRRQTAAVEGACERCERNGEEVCLVPLGDAPDPQTLSGCNLRHAWKVLGGDLTRPEEDTVHQGRRVLTKLLESRPGASLDFVAGSWVHASNLAFPSWRTGSEEEEEENCFEGLRDALRFLGEQRFEADCSCK